MASINPCRAVGSTSGLDALVDTIFAAASQKKLTSLSARPKGKRAPEGPQQEFQRWMDARDGVSYVGAEK